MLTWRCTWIWNIEGGDAATGLRLGRCKIEKTNKQQTKPTQPEPDQTGIKIPRSTVFISLCIFIKYYYIYLFVNGGSLQAADGVKVYFYSGHVNLASTHLSLLSPRKCLHEYISIHSQLFSTLSFLFIF